MVKPSIKVTKTPRKSNDQKVTYKQAGVKNKKKTQNPDSIKTGKRTKKNERTEKFAKLLAKKGVKKVKKKQNTTVDLNALIPKLEKLLEKFSGEKTLDDAGTKLLKQVRGLLADGKMTDKEKLRTLKNFVKEILEELTSTGKKINKNDLRKLLEELKLVAPEQSENTVPVREAALPRPEALEEEAQVREAENLLDREMTGDNHKVVVIDLRKPESGDKNNKRSRRINTKEGKIAAEPVEFKAEEENSPEKVVKYVATNKVSGKAGSEGSYTETMTKHFQGLKAQDVARLKETMGNEIVKNTGIILKNNNKGEIRLILKPESLGRVRIQVNLNNNNIDGRIFVENNTVREMFESSLNNLNNAFKNEGFDNISLQVSVGNGNPGQQQKQQEPDFVYKESAEEFERNMPLVGDYNPGHSLVNLVV